MQIVIDIDEKYYEAIKHDVKVLHNDFVPYRIIANGMPLPKEYGRLISEKEVLAVILFSKLFDDAKVGEVKEALLNIPTIIEAEVQDE